MQSKIKMLTLDESHLRLAYKRSNGVHCRDPWRSLISIIKDCRITITCARLGCRDQSIARDSVKDELMRSTR
jgi:hypothetical protein